jgi:hypothetical protein
MAWVRSPYGKSAAGQGGCDKEGENATCRPGEEEEATRGDRDGRRKRVRARRRALGGGSTRARFWRRPNHPAKQWFLDQVSRRI